MEAELAERARSQEGLLSTADLRGLGLPDRRLRHLRRSGSLVRVAPQVYEIAGVPRTHRYALRLGLLALGPDAVVSYEAAAHLHGLDRSNPTAVEFTVPRRQRSSTRDHHVHTTQWLPRTDIVDVDGFATTSATRTIIDLAHARRPVERVEAAIDSAVRLGLSAPTALERRVGTLRGSGRWGCRLIDELVVDSGGHSMLERRFLELVRQANLPRPRLQAVQRRTGRHVARVDFLFEEQRVVVEVSGRRGHSTPTDRARDAQRRNELQELGFAVYEYTWADVTRQPAMVVRTLSRRLGF